MFKRIIEMRSEHCFQFKYPTTRKAELKLIEIMEFNGELPVLDIEAAPLLKVI